MKMNKKMVTLLLAMAIVVVIIVIVFFKTANSKNYNEGDVALSKTQSVILEHNLDIDYPQSPRAVVKYYAELSQCMYDTQNTEKDVADLAVQSRKLFDNELYMQQTDEQYLTDLKSTIKKFTGEKRRIVSFTVSSSTDVEYYTLDSGDDMASLYCIYTLQKGSLNYSDNEEYILRKDSSGHWRILGWQAAIDNSNSDGSK